MVLTNGYRSADSLFIQPIWQNAWDVSNILAWQVQQNFTNDWAFGYLIFAINRVSTPIQALCEFLGWL